MSEEPNKIRITAADLEEVQTEMPRSNVVQPQGATPGDGPRSWGKIAGPGSAPTGAPEGGSLALHFFLKSWVYLGLAGMGAAFLAWAICEPGFEEGERGRWGNMLMFPMLITGICIAFALAESVVERSPQKALVRGLLALLLGIVLGFVFYFIGNIIYGIGLAILVEAGGKLSASNPALWLTRAIAWMAFGVAGGLVYGIAERSGKKCLYGVLGGVLGAGIGGLCFDPISLLAGGAGASRCIGMMVLGASTGIAVGLVESALKNRWLYVSGGPLAGKQFILYKAVTRLGSDQANEIYLFKDLSIEAMHATIELRGSNALLSAIGATYVGGQPVKQSLLRSGDAIQIGRYTFQYQEKQA